MGIRKLKTMLLSGIILWMALGGTAAANTGVTGTGTAGAAADKGTISLKGQVTAEIKERAGLTPSHFLYFAGLGENIRLWMQSDTDAAAKLELEYAEERLAEAKVEKDKGHDQEVRRLVDDYLLHVQAAGDVLAEMKGKVDIDLSDQWKQTVELGGQLETDLDVKLDSALRTRIAELSAGLDAEGKLQLQTLLP